MNRKVFLLSAVYLCATMAGTVLAGNAERTMQLRTGEADAANVSLRSTLEPGHNRPDSAISYKFYENELQPYTKRVFTYAGDIIKEAIYREWNNGEWNDLYYEEEEYTFDAYGNQTLSICRWYYDRGISDYKYEYAYNPNGTPLYERSYDWKDGEWKLDSDMTYQYDASGMLTGGTFCSPYTTGGAVIPLTVSGTPENLEISITANETIYAKFVRHYDPVTMKLLGKESFGANEYTGVIDEFKSAEEYTYDAAGRLLTELYWNKDYAYKMEFVYDAAGRKLSMTQSDAKGKAGPFTFYGKTEYEYDGDRLVNHKWYLNDRDGLGPTLYEITVYYYAGGGTGNEQAPFTEVSVYPNPVTDVLTVSGAQAGATLTVTSLSGSTVVRKTLADTETTLSVSSLPSGLYFVTVCSGKGTATFKIIKK
jgi:YD repeat-containing protein